MATDDDKSGYGGGENNDGQQQAGSGQEAAFYALIGRAIVDPDFRQQLRGGDPHAALKSIGIEPTDDLVNAVGQAMGEVDRLSSQFGDIKAAT